MSFRIATLNLARNEKRWQERPELIAQQLAQVKPDILSLNEIWLPDQTGRWLRKRAQADSGIDYQLIEQPRAAKASAAEAEGVLTRFPPLDHSHRFFSAGDTVTLVVRHKVEGGVLDLYVTHLYPSRHEESERVGQVRELLAWIEERDDADCRIVCGDCNAPPQSESMKLMAERFRATQLEPTAFTPLREPDGEPTHPEWPRFDRCIDYIWIADPLEVCASGLCFNQPVAHDDSLWPSDHVGVWANLEWA